MPVGFECATASLAVIAVLVQASRKKAGVDAIVAAMEFLGQCGIRPDAETMEVFCNKILLISSLSYVLN